MARILIVDDDPDVRLVIQEALASQGHTFATAASGPEALKQLSKLEFDLVVLDRRMPQMGGIETLKKIRSTPATEKIKVLMCTSLGMMGQVDEAFQAGANDYIVKPLDLEKLRWKVKKLTTLPDHGATTRR
jgi:CheY-like chemotaxis protein